MRASISPHPRLQGIQYLWGMAGELTTQNNAIGTPFKTGNPGRPHGSTNHITKTVKETVLAVFNELQSDPKTSLKAFAVKYPRDFHNIAARLIPTEFTGSLKHIINVTDIEPEENA